MRIVGGMGEDGNISLSVTSPLVSRYFSNFRGMLTSSKDSPSGLKVEKAGPDTAIVIFPPGEVGMAGPAQGSGMNSVMAIIRRFVVGSLKYRSKKTEFCPILDFSGGEPGEYSFEQLQNNAQTCTADITHRLCVKYKMFKLRLFDDIIDLYLNRRSTV